MTHPRPSFVQARTTSVTPGHGDPEGWAAWEVRLDASAAERKLDPVEEARILANAAVLRRYRVAMGGR